MPFALLAALAIQAAPSTAPDQPRWALAQDAWGCVLQRQEAMDGKPSVLQLRADPTRPEIDLDLLASAGAIPALGPNDNPFTVSVGGVTATSFGFSRSVDAERRLLHVVLSLDAIDRMLSDGDSLTVTAGKRSMVIPAPSLAVALTSLRSCHRAWLLQLGADPVAWATGRQPTLSNPGRWYTRDDYPTDGVAHPSGKATVLLRIDSAGRPQACEVIAAPDKTLGDTTCRVAMQRATAKPGVDAAGVPVAGVAFLTITWSP